MQPLFLHSHAGPNPWKVALVLELLQLPHESKIWQTADLKEPPFTTTLSANGYVPVLEDPNTGVTLSESGAIINYILAQYDSTAHKLSFSQKDDPAAAAALQQYSFFQATTQGPALSNALKMAQRGNTDGKAYFIEESKRILSVLEGELTGERKWLVGGRMSVADVVFVPYTWSLPLIAPDISIPTDYPHVNAWLERMMSMDEFRKLQAERAKALAALRAAAPAPRPT